MTMTLNVSVNPPRNGWDKKWTVLEWGCQSQDLHPTDRLWGDLKHDVHAKNPASILQLKEFCIEEQEKIPSC